MIQYFKNETWIQVRQTFIVGGQTLTIGILEKPWIIPSFIMGPIDAAGSLLDYHSTEHHHHFYDAFEAFDGRWTQLIRCGCPPVKGSFHQPKSLGLYLDDIFTPAFLESETHWMHASTVQRAIALIERYGVPDIISFDHDLGEDCQGQILPTGHELAKLLVEKIQDGDWVLPRGFTYTVHSSNFEGRKKIEGLLEPFLHQWRSGQLEIA